LIVSIPFIFTHCLNVTKISYTTLHFDKNKNYLYLNTLLWDTGAEGSIIYEEHKDKIPNRIQIGFSLIFDAFNKMKFQRFYYSSQYNPVDFFYINNFFFTVTNQSEAMKSNNEMGLIGTDVIGKANWVIDFNSEKVEILPQKKIYKSKEKPQLTFQYNRKRRPKTQLNFFVCQFEDVLIDAGFDEEMALLKSDIEEINKTYKPINTFTVDRCGTYSTVPIVQNVYVYDSLIINNICFTNVQIIEGNKRLIGFKFFKRFEKVFLNTKEKEFCFY
jgi:hypothetical protein